MKTPYTYDNSRVVDCLADFWRRREGVEEYPALDDILVGVCRLDYGGNKKPLSASKLYWLLSTTRTVTVAGIEAVTGNSYGHAAKLASAVKIASRAFVGHLEQVESRREVLHAARAHLEGCRHALREHQRRRTFAHGRKIRPRKTAVDRPVGQPERPLSGDSGNACRLGPSRAPDF